MASASVLALCVGLGAGSAASQTMPTGGQVVAGSATITQPSAGQVTIRQTTDRGVINWQSFSVGAGGTVDFQQPSSSSATLNRVTGGFSSVIAGQISANGQVFLVNPNGIQITPTGTVRTGAFVASTLDIRKGDFLAGRTIFEGNGASASVTNQGTIQTPDGGSVVLVGGRVVNEGTIIANGGRVGLASGERVVVDLQGDGFLQVSVPTADADRAEALVKHAGRIQANGGRVQMRAATTADVARAAINVSGTIEARTVTRTDGGVVFGGDTPKPQPAQPTVQRSKVVIDGGPGGSVSVTGKIVATGGTQRGGDIAVSGRSVTASGTFDVSGGTSGGTITADGGTRFELSGMLRANGDVAGGRIDLTADQLLLTSAHLSATGGDVGGLVRLGGAFQGGKVKNNAPEIDATFVTRWADAPALRSATTTIVDAATTIDVSGGKTGGTAIVWSNDTTWMAGSVKATGALSAGSVELSGARDLAFVDFSKLTIGTGGQLLLDPKFIVIDTAGGSSATSANNQFADNPTGTNNISVASLTALLNADTNVTLQANTDITVNAGWTAASSGSSGNLTLQAGRSVIFASGITIDTDGGNFSVLGNNSSAQTANRDAGASTINMAGLTLVAGNVTVTMGNKSTGGDIRLGNITASGNVNVTFTSTATAGNVELNGNITSTTGDINLPDRNIVVRANSTLTSGPDSGDDVNWTGESGGKSIAGFAGGEQVKFVERGNVVRIGVMDTANAARLTVGQTSATRVYGDANPDVTAPRLISGTLRGTDTLDSILAPGSASVSWALGTPVATTPVGSRSYTVTPSNAIALNAGKVGYFVNSESTVNGALTISRRPITLSADAKTRIYGNADPALTYQITAGNLVGSDTLSGALSRTAGTNVGVYSINQNTLTNANNGNYNITYVGANFTITARPITVTADAKTRIYGDADPALTYQITAGNLVGADTLSGGLTRVAGTNVGTYAINQGTLAATSNYAMTYAGSVLTITPATLNVTANAQTKVYGNVDPTLSYSASGFKFSDTAGGVLSGVLSRTAGETVAGGPYAITQGSLAANSNYTLAYTGANLSITPATLSVTANAQSKVYGDADPTLSYSASGFKFSDTAGGVLSGVLSRTAGETVAASPYAITQGSLAANSNYTLAYTGANLSITPATLNVTANAQTKVYGDADPTLSYTASGFKFSDTTGSVLSGVLSRTAGETVAGGPYAITQGSLAANSNYTLAYTGANLSITPATLNVTANAQSKVYGDADPTLSYSASGFKFSDTAGSVLSGVLSRTAGETVAGGPYAITQGSLAANSNYTLAYTGANLAITPATLSVTANAQSKVYGDADPTLSYSASGFKFSDTAGGVLSGVLSRTAGETVAGGPYAITQGSLAANSNYTLAYTGANLAITPATLSVTANAQSKVYGDADPTLSYSASGFKFSDTAGGVLSGVLSRTAGETVAGGPYAITQGSLAANSNYTLAYTGANLAITPATLNVTANAQSKVYGDADPTLSYTASGFKFSDTAGGVLSGVLSRTAGETVAGGPYAITQGSLAANSNYTLAYTGANLAITPATLSVTANAQSKVYGDADPTLSYSASGFKFSDTAGGVLSGVLSRTAGETVAGGPYAITQGSLAANSNYTLAYTGANLAITPATLSVTANAQSKVYGDADPTLSYSASGFKFSDTAGGVLSGVLSRTAGETVAGGPYAITQGSLAANSNYTLAYTGANFAITPRPITVTADDKTKIAFNPDPAFTWTVTAGNVVPGDTSTGALTRPPGETAGAYPITQGTFSYGSNYALSFVDGVLTIQLRPTTPLPPATIPGQTTPGIPSLPGESGPSPTQAKLEDVQSGACRLNRYGTLICNGGT